MIRFSAPGALCCAQVRPKVMQSEALFSAFEEIVGYSSDPPVSPMVA